jgi:hypothetical protein
MMIRRSAIVLALAAALALVLPAPDPSGSGGAQAQQRRPLLIEGRQQLFQRVITRPGATLSPRPEVGAPSRPVPGFSVFYVYARRGGPEGWIEVGTAADGRVEGWIPAARAIDWKQTLVLAFNNPAGRERTMFFRDAETARRLWLAGPGRAEEASRLREAAAAGQEGPVIALEPETFVDITRQFYLLPILSARMVQDERADDTRLLEVLSAPAEPPPRLPPDPDALRDYRGAIVFVVDTTVSMGPYIDRTREALRRVVARVGDTAVRDNFRFGMVAFRDHTGGDPRLEYVTRMISTPSFAEAPDAILERLALAQEATMSNEDFDEDALAGIKLALDEVPWGEFGGRFIVLVTDAGTREATDPRSLTRMGPREMNELARSEAKQVAIFAIHLRTPQGRTNHVRAERQYHVLTRFRGTEPLYYPVPEGGVPEFGAAVDRLTDALLAQVAQAVGRPIAGIRAPQTDTERRISEQAAVVGMAMRLSYLGRVRQEGVPDVVRSFALDEDPADPHPDRRPLDARVLLTRNQLSDLAGTLRDVLQSANRLSPETFFSRIRAAAAASTHDPRRMAEFQRLGGAFGEYLEDLPYRSQIMEITQREWIEMGAGRRREILNSLASKLRLYEEFNRQPSLWVSFDGGRNPGEAMYPVPLTALP